MCATMNLLAIHPVPDPQSKDFLRINARKVKELQGKCQSQLEEEAKKGPMKGVHLADKYNHIQPKVTAYIKVHYVFLLFLSNTY